MPLNNTQNTQAAPPIDTITIDAMGQRGPVPVLALKKALKTAGENALLAVHCDDPHAHANIQSFCAASGHLYRGRQDGDGSDVFMVKKRTLRCQTCSRTRVALGGIAILATLVYTAPLVAYHQPSPTVIVAFAIAVGFLPPVLYNGLSLVRETVRTRVMPKK
ncbi:sulfurtransferase TusA family protein [Varunaivibrio sulfuroxidans]|uniref:TusA-related sulfurtransferase n=1 Tax=Varunaivibrio sulfuroxidans TaxID=1773489 RepID=A0A4R3JHJ9_9PROT|nr:sulfurtransferase TusA family protein [Varunaivibrio sulfuroxidans]TCS64736.1 TusA-related sulfurtransferase [Varunaivibrio sulfuroxidans]WES29959.1 sulfurtransferase TusA family protein [Varunaivibrio sulfuroxidans]